MSTKKRTITLKSQIMEVIDERAKNENRNFSNMVETMLIKHLKDDGQIAMQ